MKNKTLLDLAKRSNLLQRKINSNAEAINRLALDTSKASKEIEDIAKEYNRRTRGL